ncbi:MAG: RDD family protein [Zoogloeaceae bacterium]|nr:RDD family protein [Zoogloeaceae bacterium]
MKKKPSAQALPAADRPVVELAGLRRRLASMLYEVLLLLGVLAVAFIIPHVLIGFVAGVSFAPWILWLHLFLVLGAYFVWYWHRHGATLAMQTWRLKLVDARDGRPLTTGRAALRYALSWPSLWLFGVGILWVILDRDRQFLHDRLAGTCIVLLPQERKA